jgi:hypothetical protein
VQPAGLCLPADRTVAKTCIDELLMGDRPFLARRERGDAPGRGNIVPLGARISTRSSFFPAGGNFLGLSDWIVARGTLCPGGVVSHAL